jgi:tRNA(fMet)-specific endonuclease VapC
VAVRGVVLDTNAYGALLKGEPEAVDVVRHAPAIGLSIVVLGELLAGFSYGTRYAANLERLEHFLSSERVTVLSADRGIAEHYASIYSDLRRRGRMIPTNDI